MNDTRSETWAEIKNGIGDALKILIYSLLGLGLFFGVAYIYVTCCQ